MTREEALEKLAAGWIFIFNNYDDRADQLPKAAVEWAMKIFPQDTDQTWALDEAMLTLFGDTVFHKKQ